MVVELVDVLVLVELDVEVDVLVVLVVELVELDVLDDVLVLDELDVDELVDVEVVVAQASSSFFQVAVVPLVAVWTKSLFVPV